MTELRTRIPVVGAKWVALVGLVIGVLAWTSTVPADRYPLWVGFLARGVSELYWLYFFLPATAVSLLNWIPLGVDLPVHAMWPPFLRSEVGDQLPHEIAATAVLFCVSVAIYAPVVEWIRGAGWFRRRNYLKYYIPASLGVGFLVSWLQSIRVLRRMTSHEDSWSALIGALGSAQVALMKLFALPDPFVPDVGEVYPQALTIRLTVTFVSITALFVLLGLLLLRSAFSRMRELAG